MVTGHMCRGFGRQLIELGGLDTLEDSQAYFLCHQDGFHLRRQTIAQPRDSVGDLVKVHRFSSTIAFQDVHVFFLSNFVLESVVCDRDFLRSTRL